MSDQTADHQETSDQPLLPTTPEGLRRLALESLSRSLRLTAQQVAFCHSVAAGLTATSAYLTHFPGVKKRSAQTMSCNLMKRLSVKRFLAALRAPLQEETSAEVARLVKETCRIAFSDPRQMFDQTTGDLLPFHKMPEEIARAVASVKIERRTTERGETETVTVRLWDKNSAIDKLFRHYGGYRDEPLPAAGDMASRKVSILYGVPIDDGQPAPMVAAQITETVPVNGNGHARTNGTGGAQ